MQFEILVNNLAILEMIPVILMIILWLWSAATSTGRNRILSLLGFIITLCFAGTMFVLVALRMDIITLTDFSNWGIYVDFGLRGIIYFLLVIFMTIWADPDFFSERKWAIIVALIGPIIFEILMFSYFGISSIYAPAFWITMLVVALLYMAVIPLMATIQRTRKDDVRGSTRVIWFWVIFLGLLLWFFGEANLALSEWLHLPGYGSLTSEVAVLTISLHTAGWYLILLGFVFQQRASKADTS